MNEIRVGDISVVPVLENNQVLWDVARLFPDATQDLLDAESGWMEPAGYDGANRRMIGCVQSFVFEAGPKTVLVDTCVGNGKQGRPRPDWNNGNWPWLENLSEAGYRPGDIDFVLCTHLHADHTGWNTRLDGGRWVPTFPNAQYLTSGIEMDALQRRIKELPWYRLLYEDSVLPMVETGQSVLVDMDHKIMDGVQFEPSPGHTPGHVSVRIGSGQHTAVAIGDMIHHPIQALYPDWSSGFCEDPSLRTPNPMGIPGTRRR